MKVKGTSITGEKGLYEFGEEPGTVRKVAAVEEEKGDAFYVPDIAGASPATARENTLYLYHWLRDRLKAEVTLKRQRYNSSKTATVRINGVYECFWRGHGYIIRDLLNHGEKVNQLKYENDFPTPMDVVAFLNIRLATTAPVVEGTPIKVAASGHTFDENGKLVSRVSLMLRQKEENPEALTTEEQIQLTIYEVGRFAEGEVSLDQLKQELYPVIQNTGTKVLLGRWLSKIPKSVSERNHQIREMFESEVLRTEEEVAEFEFFDVPNDFVRDILWNGDVFDPLTIVRVKHDIHSTVEGRALTVETKYKLFQWQWRQALHLYPECMSLLMEVATDATPYNLDLFRAFKFRSPASVEFDEKTLDTTKQVERLYELAWEIIRMAAPDEYVNPLWIKYVNSGDYKIGEDVMVYWPDHDRAYKGRIVKSKHGLEVRYEDGSCRLVSVWQTVKKL